MLPNAAEPEEEFEEELHYEVDLEPEVENLPLVAHAPNHNGRMIHEGATPMWVYNMDRWSHEQGQPRPYNRDCRFYDLSEGGPANRALPIMVARVARCNIPKYQE